MTTLAASEVQEMRASLRAFLADHVTSVGLQHAIERDADADRELWRSLARDLGLGGLLIPARYGGLELGYVAARAMLHESGRVLLRAPLLSSAVLATELLLRIGGEADHERWLPMLADGSATATVALCESASWQLDSVTMRAQPDGRGIARLTGAKQFVPDGFTADLYLVVARSEAGLGLFAVKRTAPGVVVSELPTLDLTRPQARLELTDAPALQLGGTGDATPALTDGLARAAVALAAESVGAAERCVEMSVAHASTRVQFGRPIGAFQAVKHRLADGYVAVRGADAVTSHAAQVAQNDEPGLAAAAAVARAASAEALLRAARDCVQVHGAMGFTWECDVHWYLKRAKSDAQLLGSPTAHRARLFEGSMR